MPALRNADDRRFLTAAHSMRAEIKRFADAVVSSDKPPSVVEARGRESELRVAIEELRAQNDTLFEACARLEQEIAKYRDLYDGAPDALVTTDERGTILDANVATAALLDFPHEMLAGKLLIAFVARGDTFAFRSHLRQIVEGPRHGTFSTRIRPRGSRPVLAHFAVRAVHGLAPSARRQGEPRIVLHWTVRTDAGRHPHEGYVYDLLGTAAEELRAPVTAALGWSRLLHDGTVPEAERPPAFVALTECAQAQKALLDQIAELVALARESEPAAAVSLGDVVEYAADRARAAAALRSVLVTVERSDEEPRTRARADHLTWALDRLLTQAVQAASSPGTVHVQVGVVALHATVRVFATGAPTLGGSRLAVAVARVAIERQGGALHVPELAEDGIVLQVRLPVASS
jgi:PAS domain S-box-containing protein